MIDPPAENEYGDLSNDRRAWGVWDVGMSPGLDGCNTASCSNPLSRNPIRYALAAKSDGAIESA